MTDTPSRSGPPPTVSDLARRCRGAAERYGTTVSHVLSRILRLRAVEGFRADESFLWGLADPKLPGRELARYVSAARLRPLQERLNPTSGLQLVTDRAAFGAFCRGAGLPAPALYGVYHRDAGWSPGRGTLEGEDWRRFFGPDLPAPTFVVKPVRLGADGLRLLRRRGADAADGFLDEGDPEAGSFDLATLRRRLDADGRAFVVQERLRPHPELERLSGTETVQTVRAVTHVDSARRARVLFACFRVAVGAGPRDSFDGGRSGHYLADIDLESGRLDAVRGVDPSGFGLVEHRSHPATGVIFDRFVLPHWTKVRRLAEEAALRVLPLRSIGWDLAITPVGPAILGASARWAPLHNAHQQLPRFLELRPG